MHQPTANKYRRPQHTLEALPRQHSNGPKSTPHPRRRHQSGCSRRLAEHLAPELTLLTAQTVDHLQEDVDSNPSELSGIRTRRAYGTEMGWSYTTHFRPNSQPPTPSMAFGSLPRDAHHDEGGTIFLGLESMGFVVVSLEATHANENCGKRKSCFPQSEKKLTAPVAQR